MKAIRVSIDRSGVPGRYDVDILHSPVGEASATVALDVDRLMEEREAWQQAILLSSIGTRRIVSELETVVREVGQELFEAVFGTPAMAARYRSSVDHAANRGEPLQVVLRISAPELTALPWEAMYDPHSGTYVSRVEPLVRHVPVASAPRPLRVQYPVRILGITASPRGLPALDVEVEEEHLTRALEEQVRRSRVELHWIRNATWDSIHDTLLSEPWHIVHFIGHGDFDAEIDEGVLALVGANGRAHHVEASRFADLLHEASPMPRLLVLNSCKSGQAGTTDLFSGTASALVRGGVGAVVAMQFEITDLAAAAFARGFYSAIAAGRPVDEAVRSGRVSILGLNGRTLEWVTPILYIRGQENRLFTVKKTQEPVQEKELGAVNSTATVEAERAEAQRVEAERAEAQRVEAERLQTSETAKSRHSSASVDHSHRPQVVPSSESQRTRQLPPSTSARRPATRAQGGTHTSSRSSGVPSHSGFRNEVRRAKAWILLFSLLFLAIVVWALSGNTVSPDATFEPVEQNRGEGGAGENGSGDGLAQTVTVGSADFPESQIVAELYVGALESAGVETETVMAIGSREAYVGAVQDGSVDVVPDYSGNLLLFADPEATASSAEEIMEALPEALPEDLTVLEPAEAENKDALVVTPGTAEQYGLTSIADLAAVCDQLVLAAYPEFAERAYGLEGLEERYGCVPASFEPIDDGGGPLTLQALLDGNVDVADIFTTTPSIVENDLVVLEDPENNFIAQQVVPLTAEDRLPQEAVDALNELSGKLTTEDLIELNRRVSGQEQVGPAEVAQEWLSSNGF